MWHAPYSHVDRGETYQFSALRLVRALFGLITNNVRFVDIKVTYIDDTASGDMITAANVMMIIPLEGALQDKDFNGRYHADELRCQYPVRWIEANGFDDVAKAESKSIGSIAHVLADAGNVTSGDDNVMGAPLISVALETSE